MLLLFSFVSFSDSTEVLLETAPSSSVFSSARGSTGAEELCLASSAFGFSSELSGEGAAAGASGGAAGAASDADAAAASGGAAASALGAAVDMAASSEQNQMLTLIEFGVQTFCNMGQNCRLKSSTGSKKPETTQNQANKVARYLL